MSSREFNEWIAFYNLDPFGMERDDLRSAIIAATVANVNRSSEQEPLSPEEFMPRLGERALITEDVAGVLPAVSPEQGVATLEMLNAMFGGRDLRKR